MATAAADLLDEKSANVGSELVGHEGHGEVEGTMGEAPSHIQLIDTAAEIGVTSGASVPEVLVAEVLDFLAAQGWPAPEEIVTTEERQVFTLPRALPRG